ncbi:TFIIB-type zinc finger domain-containing protein [Acidimangrovimonas sediminis]|uniref:TFIIB-type zinc finger domain-containing protein n=1 Tax=Acidimangrovimonas sediminis TaxID=2056283 RepID=UPI000C8092C8|nr:TFIIB-type zinc finger domain-containing protein [Acidimangrovimonas sediminis]
MTDAQHHTPCPQCGAELRFDPARGMLHCDHCGHEEPAAPGGLSAGGPKPPQSLTRVPSTRAAHEARQSALNEQDYRAALANALPPSQMEERRTVTCPSCGASFDFDPAVHAAECPFCATPIVTDTGAHRQIKPQAVVPFQLDQTQAREAMTAWLGRLWFAPNGLVDYARKGRAMNGIYVPYWTYDATTRTEYTGQRGEAYYETETVVVNVNGRDEMQTRQVRRIAWYPAAGTVGRRFDDVLVMASTGLPRDYVDALEPWDLGTLTAYSPDYLAGFRAEGYTVGLRDGFGIAQQKMQPVIEGDVRADIGGDEQMIASMDTETSDETFKHVLLPIWMAAYKYRGKTYRFVVNGQTGRVRGERPWSAWKIAFAVLLALIALGIFVIVTQNR